MRLKHLISGTASVMVLAIATGSVAYAQDTATPTETVFGDLVVTAQKREQRLQDVPVVVTVVGAQLLEDAGIKDIKDLTVLTPGMTVTSSSSEASTTIRIRGIGTVGDNPGLESSVGVVIDGIYRPRNGVALGDLGELSRVEVLKGPQGTLFGKNSTAGIVNIVTAPPSFKPGVTLEGGGGNFGDKRGTVSITGPIIADKLAGRLFVGGEDRDGFQSVVTGAGPRADKDDGDRHFVTARGALLYLPSSTIDIKLSADYTKRDENCCTSVSLVPGSFAGNVTNNALFGGNNVQAPAVADSRVTYANRSTRQVTTDKGGALELNWDTPLFGGAKLTSLTAARNWGVTAGQDADFTTLDILYREPDGRNFTLFDQKSEELRLSNTNGKFTWTVGGFYAREKLTSSQSLTVGNNLSSYLDVLVRAGANPLAGGPVAPFPGNPVQVGGLGYILNGAPNFAPGQTAYDVHRQEGTSSALFANTDYAISDKLILTLGARYTEEKKDLVSRYQNVDANGNLVSATCQGAILGAGAAGLALAGGGPTAQKLFVGYYCAAFNDTAFNNVTQNQTRKDDAVTGTAKLAYKPNDNVMAYASYARGFKAGGFNLDRVRIPYCTAATLPPIGPCPTGLGLSNGLGARNPNTGFAPETVDSFELGAKTTWLDGHLLLNTALYYQDYQNFQLNAFDGIAFTVYSIPKAVAKGIDFDVLWQTPVTGLSLQGGATYNDSKFGNNLPGYNDPLSPFYIGGGALGRLSGGTLPFAPKFSTSAAVTYVIPVSETYQLRSNVSAKYSSDFNTGSDLNPLKQQKAMTLVNARIGFGPKNDSWAIEAWGQNLTDVHYVQVAFDATLQPGQINGFLGAPRTYGLTLRIKPFNMNK
jgi:iron complex outermembrane receptor protein